MEQKADSCDSGAHYQSKHVYCHFMRWWKGGFGGVVSCPLLLPSSIFFLPHSSMIFKLLGNLFSLLFLSTTVLDCIRQKDMLPSGSHIIDSMQRIYSIILKICYPQDVK